MKQGVAKVGQNDQRATQALIIFTRVPIEGRVKTRLSPPLDADEAAEIQRCFLQDILDTAAHADRCEIVVAYTPSDRRNLLKDVLTPLKPLVPQRGKDTGERMRNAFQDVFEKGYERAVLIGTDIPTLPLRYINEAFELLDSREIVVGVNADGGYYLIGMQKPVKNVFEGIDWGTDRVLEQTFSRIEQKRLKLACLDVWYDVDTPEDLKFLKVHLKYLKENGEKIPERTCRFLERLRI